MPPRIRLSAEDQARLPALLAMTAERAAEFPQDETGEAQVAWLYCTYGTERPLSVPLLTLLLFEHGPHRSAETVAQELASARKAGLLNDA